MDSRRVFKATLAHYTALKSIEESVQTASLNDVRSFEGVDDRDTDSDVDDDATRRRTFVGKNG